jgi:hypothetical protein
MNDNIVIGIVIGSADVRRHPTASPAQTGLALACVASRVLHPGITLRNLFTTTADIVGHSGVTRSSSASPVTLSDQRSCTMLWMQVRPRNAIVCVTEL